MNRAASILGPGRITSAQWNSGQGYETDAYYTARAGGSSEERFVTVGGGGSATTIYDRNLAPIKTIIYESSGSDSTATYVDHRNGDVTFVAKDRHGNVLTEATTIDDSGNDQSVETWDPAGNPGDDDMTESERAWALWIFSKFKGGQSPDFSFPDDESLTNPEDTEYAGDPFPRSQIWDYLDSDSLVINPDPTDSPAGRAGPSDRAAAAFREQARKLGAGPGPDPRPGPDDGGGDGGSVNTGGFSGVEEALK